LGIFDSPEEKRAKCILAVLEKYDGKTTETYMDPNEFLEFITALFKAWLYSDLKNDCKCSGKNKTIRVFDYSFDTNSKLSATIIENIMNAAHRKQLTEMLEFYKRRRSMDSFYNKNDYNTIWNEHIQRLTRKPTYILEFWLERIKGDKDDAGRTKNMISKNMTDIKSVCNNVYFIF
jgi:hypothetical protein